MSKLLTIFGLFIDIVGAFLLGVEAIGLDNIQMLKIRFLEPFHSHSQSPRLFIRGNSKHNERVAALGQRLSENWPPGLFQGLHWIAGLIILLVLYQIWPYALDWYFHYWFWVSILPWYFLLPLGLWSALVSIASIGLVWGLGEIVHIAIEKNLSGALRIAEFVLNKTDTGFTGIVGMVLLIVGFTMQAIGAIMS